MHMRLPLVRVALENIHSELDARGGFNGGQTNLHRQHVSGVRRATMLRVSLPRTTTDRN